MTSSFRAHSTNNLFRNAFVVALAATTMVLRAADSEETFQPLFDGQSLDGWIPVNVAPATFTVQDGVIVSTGFPTGIMRTETQYENFILELEWKHLHPKGNAGLFIWSEPMTAPGTPFAKSIEVQILDPEAGNSAGTATGHGDVFSIHGATMTPVRPHPGGWARTLPSEHRVKPAGEWNHYRVEARDGNLSLAVNGKIVSGALNCKPRMGYICLESEGSECHFRNIRVHELPSTSPTDGETASTAEDWKSLYNGLDLDGWKIVEGSPAQITPKDWILEFDGTERDVVLLYESPAERPGQIQLDWQLIDPDASVRFNGIELRTDSKPIGRNAWNRTHVSLTQSSANVTHNQNDSEHHRLVPNSRKKTTTPSTITLSVSGGRVQLSNIFASWLNESQ